MQIRTTRRYYSLAPVKMPRTRCLQRINATVGLRKGDPPMVSAKCQRVTAPRQTIVKVSLKGKTKQWRGMQQAKTTHTPLLLLLSRLYLRGSGSAVRDLVANTQLFVRTEELHTLEVTSQGTVTQIEAHVASLEGFALEDQVLPPGRHHPTGWGYSEPLWGGSSEHAGSSRPHTWR